MTNYVYILRCKDNSLYTGWTTDLEKRLEAHNSNIGAKYTKGRGPCKVVYYEVFDNKNDALKREAAIKKLSKDKKEILINSRKNN